MEKNIGCCLLAVLVPKVSIFDACCWWSSFTKAPKGTWRTATNKWNSMHSVVKRIPTNQIQPIHSDLLAYIQKLSPRKSSTLFSNKFTTNAVGTSSRSFKWLPVTSISSICFPIATTLLQGFPSSFISLVGGLDPSNEMGLVCWWSHRDSKDSLKKFCRDSTWDNLAVARRFQDPPPRMIRGSNLEMKIQILKCLTLFEPCI